jgi:small subunit ribosomal protein S2
LRWPLGAVVLIDVNKEASALREASAMRIPVVGLVDTNSDPSFVSYVIPGNDDAPRSIKLIVEYLEEAVRKGQEVAKVRKDESLIQESEEEETLLSSLPDDEAEEDEEGGRKGPRKSDASKKLNKKIIEEPELEVPGAEKPRPIRARAPHAPRKVVNKSK